MEHHPLTPMRDPSLLRVLGRQTPGRVGLVPFEVVEAGAAAVRACLARLREEGCRYAVADALMESHLLALGEAAADHPLITGGSGIAMGLPENFRRAGLLPAREDAASLPPPRGSTAVLAGSCSRATLAQVAHAQAAGLPVLQLDPLAGPDAAALAAQALNWAAGRLGAVPVVIAASAPPERVAALQARLGAARAAALVEETLSGIAEGLVGQGVGRMVVAGGETSGAVVSRLGVRSLRIGREIDPGVPWTAAQGGAEGLHLALKSGNFGALDFFARAFAA